jgi:hypothetical protein
MLILVVILLGHSVVWVWHIWGANRRDTAAAFHYFRKAARLAGETPANIPSAPSNWLSAVQILMTAALSVAAYFLIGQPIGHPN